MPLALCRAKDVFNDAKRYETNETEYAMHLRYIYVRSTAVGPLFQDLCC